MFIYAMVNEKVKVKFGRVVEGNISDEDPSGSELLS